MSEQDPAAHFFPGDDEPDLYGCLGLSESVSTDEIKKAYRKQALLFHPDKAGQSTENTQKFHQIGFAYAVLSDEKRRKRFDDTGRTDESFFEGEADWDAYFKELWSGEVNGKTLDDFVKSYQGSDEERDEVLASYTSSEGSLSALFENVMCSSVLEDEDRFIDIIESAIKSKEVKSFPQWKKDVKDIKGRNRRKEAAKGEAKEAEELAKELGVHDKLFGKKENGGTDQTSKDVKKGKGKRGKADKDEEEVDEDALKALIQARNSKSSSMNVLIEKLEAKYGSEPGSTRVPKKGSKGDNDAAGKKRSAKGAEEPTEEEFEALQKKLFGGKQDEDGLPPKKAKKSKKT